MYLKNNKVDYVILTSPQNPSGEVYNDYELKMLINELKMRNIKLIIDICQVDEFNNKNTYINYNKTIYEIKYNDMIIINSMSKTRSIPGARMGYIVADKEIIKYASNQSAYYYNNHPLIYVTPMILDMLFRMIKLDVLDNKPMDFKTNHKKFRQMIISKLGLGLYNSLFKNVFSNIEDTYYEFEHDITAQYDMFSSNRQYLLKILSKYIEDCTPMQGGFNFCIKIKDTKCKSQLEFCANLSKSIVSLILPESSFNGFIVEDTERAFWIRITVALPKDIFEEIVDKIYMFLEKEKGNN